MSPEVIDCTAGPPSETQWERVAAALEAGELVIFPTETVYGVGTRADSEEATQRLRDAKGDRGSKPFSRLVSSPSAALQIAGPVPTSAFRLMQTVWPGPLTLVVPYPRREDEYVGLRCPDHRVAQDLAALRPEGLASTSANLSGQAPPATAQEAAANLGDQVAIVLDAGPAKMRTASTVVRIDPDNRATVLRQGAFPAEQLRAADYTQILFVCTGNTCRSPMAEVFMRRRLAQALQVEETALRANGFVVQSAGTGAFGGSPASEGSLVAAKERGADLSRHMSQPVTPELLAATDLVFGMTRRHVAAVQQWMRGRVNDAAPIDAHGDVSDPIGGSIDQYRETAGQIEAAVEAIAAKLLSARSARLKALKS
jgi:protein-tyrosine phosphatase